MTGTNNFFRAILVGLTLLSMSRPVQALPCCLKFPIAAMQGAAAAACLVTAVACLRTCADTKWKARALAVDNPGLAARQGLAAKLCFLGQETVSNIAHIVGRTAEYAVLKTATLLSGIAVGLVGIYCARCCLETMS